MPQCPSCNAAVWAGQQYCPICDNPLPRPQEENHDCPPGDNQPANPQELRQQCQVPPLEMAGTTLTALPRTWRFPFGGLSLFLAAGLISVALVVFFLVHNSPESPQPVITPSSQTDSGKPPAPPSLPAAAPAPAVTTAVTVQEVPVPPAPVVSSPQAMTPPTPSLPRYMVKIHELSVREGPYTDASRIAVLNLKDEVELLETYGGWGKVQDLQRNIVGWSYMRFLQPLAPADPEAVSRQQSSSPQEAETISAKASQDR